MLEDGILISVTITRCYEIPCSTKYRVHRPTEKTRFGSSTGKLIHSIQHVVVAKSLFFNLCNTMFTFQNQLADIIQIESEDTLLQIEEEEKN